MKVAWFSCGCSSLVAAKLAKPDKTVYIHVADHHPDTLRFLKDAEGILGPIEVLQSDEFDGVDDVIQKRRYINGPSGAACTLQLKKRVRQKWENEHFQRFTYVWGFDLNEKARAERTIVSMPEYDHEFPLIDAGLTKADCHALCEDFPEVFERRAKQEREIGHSCIKGVFLDELEVGRGKNNPVVPECSLACVWVQE